MTVAIVFPRSTASDADSARLGALGYRPRTVWCKDHRLPKGAAEYELFELHGGGPAQFVVAPAPGAEDPHDLRSVVLAVATSDESTSERALVAVGFDRRVAWVKYGSDRTGLLRELSTTPPVLDPALVTDFWGRSGHD